MKDTIIEASNISKEYQRGMLRSNGLLRDVLAQAMKNPASMFRRKHERMFWALKDVSFEVREGEVLGLIGRNGSGKTTLLKILSRITRPTAGWANIHGRVGSLLEVGTGFHPELTGRENAFLSGAILGMSKAEIERKFDEIVAFAELGEFIDTQVKHYSSGMQVRLAFAVAAHLEPEILLVDEVLAVGDIKFQRKCLGKMGDVARSGRTIILVSHHLNQIRRLCERVIWLDHGIHRQTGETAQVVGAYEKEMTSGDGVSSAGDTGGRAYFLKWWLVDEDGNITHNLTSSQNVRVRFLFKVNQNVRGLSHDVQLYDQNRQLLWGIAVSDVTLTPGLYVSEHTLPELPLRPGMYTWRVKLWDGYDPIADWDGFPEMHVATIPVTHYRDEMAGILNIPADSVITPHSVEQPQ